MLYIVLLGFALCLHEPLLLGLATLAARIRKIWKSVDHLVVVSVVSILGLVGFITLLSTGMTGWVTVPIYFGIVFTALGCIGCLVEALSRWS
jgi:TRAP-type C4-dicarboxylate transport system permease small subunit